MRLGVGLGLGDGLLLLLGLGEGLLVGSGVLLLGLGLLMAGLGLLMAGLGLVLVLVLADGLLLGLPEVVELGVRLALLVGVAELPPVDTDAASAIPLSGRAFSAEAAVAAAGRFAHGFFAATAGAACVPVKSTLASPYESTAAPARALNLADPACRFLTVSASPWLMS